MMTKMLAKVREGLMSGARTNVKIYLAAMASDASEPRVHEMIYGAYLKDMDEAI